MLFGGIAVAAALCHRFRQPSAVFEDLMNVKGQKINRVSLLLLWQSFWN